MVNAQGSTTKQKSSQRPVNLTGNELELQGLQLEQAQYALNAYLEQAGFQRAQLPGAGRAVGGLATDPTLGSPISEADLAARAQTDFARAGRAGEVSDAQLQQELERIRSGGLATPEQRAAIQQSADEAIAAGRADIQGYSTDALEQLRGELAPSLGLRPTDTPIIDRGGLIAREGTRQMGRLVSTVRSGQAGALLSHPLAAAQVGQNQMQLADAAAASQQALQARAFENRLRLTGQVGQTGLSLASLVNFPQVQESLRPTLATESKSKSASGGAGIFSSHSALKNVDGPVDQEKVLNALLGLKVTRWRYKADPAESHIGPFAEELHEAIQAGNEFAIHPLDSFGSMLAAMQALAARVEHLEDELRRSDGAE